MTLEWSGEAQSAMGVLDREFVVHRAGDRITGSLWSAADGEGAAPLVLMGHGGRSESRNEAGVAMARRFVRRHGIAVAAIDAIEHGARGPLTGAEEAPYAELWKRAETHDRMVADWQATLDAVSALPEVDGERVGYWGLSMGTMLGLPFVAAEPRIKAAVLGLCGFAGPSAVRGRFGERHRADAPRVTCPVLFMVQWDDELFDRDGAFALFDAIGAKDKRLHAHPGKHGEIPPEGVEATREFLAGRLRA